MLLALLMTLITIYKSGRCIDTNTATLSKMLQICYEWAQECHTGFDNGDKIGFLQHPRIFEKSILRA